MEPNRESTFYSFRRGQHDSDLKCEYIFCRGSESRELVVMPVRYI